MNQVELQAISETFIRETLRKHLHSGASVYLFGSIPNKNRRSPWATYLPTSS